MKADSFFLTTAIDYTNAPPHIGHAYEKILADVLARHQRQRGKNVFFLTGVDQHGQKVQQAAEKEGIPPAQFAGNMTEKFLALWQTLDIAFDGWAATTEPQHHTVVQKILTRLHAQGDLYKAAHQGFYSVRQEQFLTDKDRNEAGEFGEEWGQVIELQEENWYFRLSKYQPWLLDHATKNPGFVFPAFRSQELRNAVERTGGDLCISRPKSRLSWGIELPFDSDFVTYVWFDALINYISFSGYLSEEPMEAGAFDARWPALHIIGKDILVPAHGIYWMCMLKAMGFADDKMPDLLVHGYVNLGGTKMSKTLGNVVDPGGLAARFGAGALRYYLMADCTCGQDMDFSVERLIIRYNTDLANGLGNLLNRTLNMAARYQEGRLAKPEQELDAAQELTTLARNSWEKVAAAMDALQPQAAIEHISDLVVAANRFAEQQAPWKLAKDPARSDRLAAVLRGMAEAVRHAASLLLPFLPVESTSVLGQLQLPALNYHNLAEEIPTAHPVAPPSPVFPRIDPATIDS
jgi:methionyl-tRNA synthetase